MLRFHLLLGSLTGLCGHSLAQDVLPTPFSQLTPGPVAGSIDTRMETALIEYAHGLENMVLEGLPVPGVGTYDLELSRVQFDFSRVEVHVDGRPSQWNSGDLSVWTGTVVGQPDSEVLLSLSSLGSYGWVHDGVSRTHITSTPGPDGDWSRPGVRIYSDAALDAVPGQRESLGCMVDDLTDGPRVGGGGAGGPLSGVTNTLHARVAVETDYQLYQKWNNLAAEQNYVMSLIAAVSDRFYDQVDVYISYPYVQFYTNSNDPWSSQDSGGSSGDLLNEFRNAWAGNIPSNANLGWFLSGANLGGGVAWVDVICNQSYGFAVSGNINGGVTFPVQRGSNTWDYFVFAHEGGHNFGSPHTHDYCPPLDKCSSNCEGNTQCTSNGTIMSYCHGCPGGMNNITTYFHPHAAGVMRTEAENSCIPNWNGETILYFDDFESGDFTTGGWTLAPTGQVTITGGYGPGNGAKLKKGGKGTPHCLVGSPDKVTWMEAPAIDTTGYTTVRVRAIIKGKNTTPNCEDIDVQWWNGSSWQSAGYWEDLTWTTRTTTLPPAAGNNSNLRVRLITNAKGAKEKFKLDDFEILGS